MSCNLRANFDPVARHHLQICILYFNQELKDNTSHVKDYYQIHARKFQQTLYEETQNVKN